MAQQKNQTKPVEARYQRSLRKLRSLRVSPDTKDLQKDLMWLKRSIEDYGFVFFANHYCYPLVMEFEKKVNKLEQDPSTTTGN